MINLIATSRQLQQDSCIKTLFLSRINIKLTSWTCLALNTLKVTFAFTVSMKDTTTKKTQLFIMKLNVN